MCADISDYNTIRPIISGKSNYIELQSLLIPPSSSSASILLCYLQIKLQYVTAHHL